jgi:hypothetical protein
MVNIIPWNPMLAKDGAEPFEAPDPQNTDKFHKALLNDFQIPVICPSPVVMIIMMILLMIDASAYFFVRGGLDLKPSPLPLLRSPRIGSQSLLTLREGLAHIAYSQIVLVEPVVISSIRPERRIKSQSSATARARFEPALQAG